MGLDPNDYDLDDLRDAAISAELGEGDPRIERAAERQLDGRRAEQYRELLKLQAADEDATGRPHLDTMPDAYAAELVVLEWLEFLNATAGFEGALDAIRYYRSIGWIAENVEQELRDYMTGVNARDSDAAPGIDVDDHVESLVFIAQLAAMT
jgi:flagellar protein FlaE